MAKEIEVTNFTNDTECRKKPKEQKLSEIERETIVNYAKSLSEEEKILFLENVPTEMLLAVLGYRMLDTECKLQSLRKKFLETL